MSEVENKTDELAEIKNKLIRCNKNLRELMEMVKSINEKISKPPDENKESEKNRINDIFEKKQIGRPVGTWESKRQQYYDMIVKGKIKQPKQETLDYYKINKHPDDGTYCITI